jgi:hypothetical protein
MLYKITPPAAKTLSAMRSMPQLDFRDALSTPEEKSVCAPSLLTPGSSALSTKNYIGLFANAVGFSRSTWANIVFVAIASLGGLFCAFYFFNGAEVVRAAAAWPAEFLYPRPISTDKLDVNQQPDGVDRFGSKTSDSKEKSADAPFDRSFFPPTLTQSGATPGTFNPGGIGGIASSSAPSTPFSNVGSVISGGLNFLPRGGDTIFQSFYQRAISLVPKPIRRITSSTISSTLHKVTRVHQSVSAKVNGAVNTASSATNSTRSTLQQTAGQVGGGQSQVTMAGGVGGSSGAGVGGSMGGGVSGPIGGSVTGSIGAGLGGSLGGALGGLGGAVGGLRGGGGGGRH